MSGARGPNVSDGRGRPPRLVVYQAWWGMAGLGSGGRDVSPEEGVERIAAAGFEGILLFFPPEGAEAARWRALLDRTGLDLAIGTFGTTIDAIAADLGRAEALGARFLNAQISDYFLRDEGAIETIAAAVESGERAGVPVLVETHRGCVTQDLLRAVEYVRALPRLRLALDLSHYVVAGQLPVMPGELWPIDPRVEDLFDVLFARTSCIHGRVSNGNQVQVDVGPDGRHPAAAHFIRWWHAAATEWRARAEPGDVLPFVCELGPPPYSITMSSPDGREEEISDRWQQALVLRELAQELGDGLGVASTAP